MEEWSWKVWDKVFLIVKLGGLRGEWYAVAFSLLMKQKSQGFNR